MFNCNYLLPIPLADKDSASADHTYEGNLSTWSFYHTAYYQVSIPFDVLRVEPKSSTRCRHVYLSPVSLFLIEHKTAKRLGSKVDHEAGTNMVGEMLKCGTCFCRSSPSSFLLSKLITMCFPVFRFCSCCTSMPLGMPYLKSLHRRKSECFCQKYKSPPPIFHDSEN